MSAGLGPLGRAAMDYAHRGVPVLPCAPSKAPIIPLGRNGASADPEQVGRWWYRWPGALIGVPTGRESGWVVLDIDVPDGEESLRALLAEHGPLSAGAWQRTRSGGRHHVFALPVTGEVRCTVGRLGPGLDVRGEGGYVVVAPSPGYSWEVPPWGPGALEPAPAFMVEVEVDQQQPQPVRLVRRDVPNGGSAYGRGALRGEVERLALAQPGVRNAALNAAAFALGRLVAGGELHADDVVDALAHVGVDIGLGRREVARTVASGLAAGMREPRQAPRRPAVRTGRSPR